MNPLVKKILKIVGIALVGIVVLVIIVGATQKSDVSGTALQTTVVAPATNESPASSPATTTPLSVVQTTQTIVSPNTTAISNYGKQTKTFNCVANQALPDPACTPGAILTTDTSIICVSGYTQTVRSVSDSLRKKVFAEYGIDYSLHGNYEVDHLISLELGGSNDISNLFPELYSIQYGARVKDTFENYLHNQACSGKISMATAQQEIATNWLKYYIEWKGSATPVTVTSVTPPTTSSTSGGTSTLTQSTATYYTSSYSTSKYYYPANCSGWKSLSSSYLKSFDTLQALLVAYPSRTLSPQCQ